MTLPNRERDERQTPSSSRLRRVLSLALGVAIVVVMVGYLATQRDLVGDLRGIPAAAISAVVALSVVTALNGGARFRISCDVFGLRLTYWHSQALTSTNTMLNYAIPLKGGFIMRAAYMKQRHGLSYTNYGGLLASSQLIAVAATGVYGLVFIGVTQAVEGVGSAVLTVAFAGSVVASIAGFVVVDWFDFTRLRPRALGRRIQAFSLGFAAWRTRPWHIARYSASMLVSVVLSAIRLLIILRALGVDAGIWAILVITAGTVLAGALSLTPGSLGVREAVVAVSAGLLGIDATVALLASVVDRAAGMLVTFAMGLLLAPTLGMRSQGQSEQRDHSIE